MKCNTNRCPTGITTQDKELQKGLDVDSKAVRVFQYHNDTTRTAVEIMGAIGVKNNASLQPYHVNRRINLEKTVTYDDLFPLPEPGVLMTGQASADLQNHWDRSLRENKRRAAS